MAEVDFLTATDDADEDEIISSIIGDDAEDAAPELVVVEVDDEDALRPMDDEAVQSAVRQLVDEAVNFSESELTHERVRAQRYYNGSSDVEIEEGRSQVVVSKVRDTIRQLMPSIMRVFLQTDRVVEFQPKGPEDVDIAKQATAYCNWAFHQNDGYRCLYEAASDSLVKKVGIVKVWWEDTPLLVTRSHDGITRAEYDALAAQENLAITEELENEDGTFDVVAVRTIERGRLAFKAIPPEDFHVNREAREIGDAFIAIHRENKRISEMVEMGFDIEELLQLDYEDNSTTDAEDDYRRGYVARDSEDGETAQDPSSGLILVSDVYCYLDADGDGISELRHFICGGSFHKILLDEPADYMPFAIFYSEIEPHAFFPRCLADLLTQDQDAATVLMRGVLDNVVLSNNPRLALNENLVNIEDAMNAELGAIIRCRQMGQIEPVNVDFIGAQTIGIMEYIDRMAESRSNTSNISAGLDPDALQSTTKVGVEATVNAAQAGAELVARNLAETGMARLFWLMLRETIANANEPVQMLIGGNFMEVDPRMWHAELDLKVNVGLGTGQPEEKMATLQQVATKQEEIFEKLGPQNPFVQWENINNTYKQMLAVMGFRDSNQFFNDVPNEVAGQFFAALEQQAQANQPPDPMAGMVAIEQAKAQAKIMVDQAKLQGDMQKTAAQLQADMQQALMTDDRERDEAEMDFALKAAEIRARFNADISRAALDAELKRQQFAAQPSGGNA